jgi:tripartite-type tricarboxylate transporter receptor subunit TctC
LGMADVRTRLDALGLEPQPVSPAEFATYVKAEIAKWAKIVKTTGITAD